MSKSKHGSPEPSAGRRLDVRVPQRRIQILNEARHGIF